MIIVDSYCHLGECRVYDQIIFENEIISSLDSNQISAAIVSPFPGAPNPARVHDDIANLAGRYPGRVFGLANVNPHISRDNYRREVERCVRELGFVGVVLDTAGHAVNPNSRDGQTVFEIARELTIPIVMHTGTGIPFGLPSTVLPRARAYSDVKIVLAHAGGSQYSFEALVVAKEAPNVYLGISWTRTDDIRGMIGDIGANRLLFSSDVPSNQASELAKLRSLGLFQFQQFQLFGQNAVSLFDLKGMPEVVEPTTAS